MNKNKDITFSIIMPAYNAEKYIQKSIESVLDQSFANWELIIIDDLSKDNSKKTIESFAKKDKRIKPIFKEFNSGSADSRNMGIEKAIGKYIAFLDSDDLWDKNFLLKNFNTFTETGAKFLFSSYRLIDDNEKEILKPFIIKDKKYNYNEILFYNRVGLLTAIYNQEFLGKMFFDTSLKSLRDDYALWLDILKKTDYGLGISDVISSYRIHSGGATSNKKKVVKAHYYMLIQHENLSRFKAFFYTVIHSIMGIKKYILTKF
jgi:glycosyltransferase involved in cell wall biosynthesis